MMLDGARCHQDSEFFARPRWNAVIAHANAAVDEGSSMKRVVAVAISLFFATGIAQAAPVQTYVEAPGPRGPPKGTMLSPAADAPVVLIVPGSGPTDRDGNSPLGVKSSSYRLLAEGLADKGVTTVRIDKRGMFVSVGAVADANEVTIDAYAIDVHAWIDTIRRATGKPSVWVFGHSEGALVALVAAPASRGLVWPAVGLRAGEASRRDPSRTARGQPCHRTAAWGCRQGGSSSIFVEPASGCEEKVVDAVR
jgi:pimeloyl-ACP methyl ester carboxylesterase